MGVETYTIQKGDTLTKIAREHYGLNGKEAYQKALEIAKNNNIANPDLIYAGTSLNLLFENEPTTQASNKECKNTSPAKEDMPAIETEKTNKEADFINKYQELIEKQRKFYQYEDAKDFGTQEPEDFNPETDTKVVFANPEIFKTENVQEKVEAYKMAALELAKQDIEANDTEDETGKKDGVLTLKEFEKAEMAFFETTYAASTKQLAEDIFLEQYFTEHGAIPTDETIYSGSNKIYQSLVNDQIANIRMMFNAFDIDNSGTLDASEVATQYVFMDAGFNNKQNSIKVNGQNDELMMALDGQIDLDNTVIYVQNQAQINEYKEILETGKNVVFYDDTMIKDIHTNMFAS